MNCRHMAVLAGFVALSLCAPTWAGEGGESSGGGNAEAAHFASVGMRIGTTFTQICVTPRHAKTDVCNYRIKFLQALKSVKILPRDLIFGPDGYPRDAINDGKAFIEISVSSWRDLAGDVMNAEQVIRLVAHEYFQIIGADQSDLYLESVTLVDLMKSEMIDFATIVGTLTSVPGGPCGLSGSLLKRLTDCSTEVGQWKLVMRTTDLKDYWMAPNGAIWSPIVAKTDSSIGAFSECGMLQTFREIPRSDGRYHPWTLPTKEDFLDAPLFAPGRYWSANERDVTKWYQTDRRTEKLIFIYSQSSPYRAMQWENLLANEYGNYTVLPAPALIRCVQN